MQLGNGNDSLFSFIEYQCKDQMYNRELLLTVLNYPVRVKLLNCALNFDCTLGHKAIKEQFSGRIVWMHK